MRVCLCVGNHPRLGSSEKICRLGSSELHLCVSKQAGAMLELCWSIVLEQCWSGAGAVLEQCWSCAGAVLERCWSDAGAVLERCWSGAGAERCRPVCCIMHKMSATFTHFHQLCSHGALFAQHHTHVPPLRSYFSFIFIRKFISLCLHCFGKFLFQEVLHVQGLQ